MIRKCVIYWQDQICDVWDPMLQKSCNWWQIIYNQYQLISFKDIFYQSQLFYKKWALVYFMAKRREWPLIHCMLFFSSQRFRPTDQESTGAQKEKELMGKRVFDTCCIVEVRHRHQFPFSPVLFGWFQFNVAWFINQVIIYLVSNCIPYQ